MDGSVESGRVHATKSMDVTRSVQRNASKMFVRVTIHSRTDGHPGSRCCNGAWRCVGICANKRWTRDLTFLTHVVPGKVHTVDVIWLTNEKVWVPAWKRAIKLRHTETVEHAGGSVGKIQVFCDPTKRNWRERVLTSA